MSIYIKHTKHNQHLVFFAALCPSHRITPCFRWFSWIQLDFVVFTFKIATLSQSSTFIWLSCFTSIHNVIFSYSHSSSFKLRVETYTWIHVNWWIDANLIIIMMLAIIRLWTENCFYWSNVVRRWHNLLIKLMLC